MPLYGAYTGNELAKYKTYRDWLGAEAGFIECHGGRKDWKDWASSPIWFINDTSTAGKASGRPIYFSIPLIPTGASLADGAANKFAGYYYGLAADILKALPDYKQIVMRTGWEFNGGWQPWASKGRESQFIGCFRSFVTEFRRAAKDAKREGVWLFNWGYNHGQNDPMPSYPGDDYVDIISSDIYLKNDAISGEFDPKDPAAAFEKHRTQMGGYQYTVNLARSRGKLAAFDEIGVTGNDAKPYLDRMFAFMDANQDVVAYFGIWMSDAAYPGNLMLASRAATGAAYKAGVLARRNQGWPSKGATPPIVTPSPAPQPAQPVNPVLDLLGDINTGGERARGRYAEPVNGLIRKAEHQAWVALVVGGRKAGTPPSGEETDPLRVLAAVYRLLDEVEPVETEARTLIAGWLVRAEPLLEVAGLLPEAPAPQPGQDDAGAELEALRRELETVRAQLAQAERANAVLQGRIRSGLLALSAGE